MDKCNICNKEITDNCDHNQGRCPHRKPMIDIQPKDTSKGHFYVSLAKSVVRVIAGIGLGFGFVAFAGAAIVAAEILGVIEELV